MDYIYSEAYRRNSIPVKFQRSISKIRLSLHHLAIETDRYSKVCVNTIEDEYHFIQVRPLFAE
jgi:hypothetical protein